MVPLVKNPPAIVGDIRGVGSIPGLGRSPGEGNGHPLQYSCLESPMDRRAWWATVYGCKESDTTEHTHTDNTHTHTHGLSKAHPWTPAGFTEVSLRVLGYRIKKLVVGFGKRGKWIRRKNFRAEFLNLDTTDIWGLTVFHCRAFLRLVGCSAASLEGAH